MMAVHAGVAALLVVSGILTSAPGPARQAATSGATAPRNLPGRVQGRRGPDDPPGDHRHPATWVHGRQAAEHHEPRRRRRSTLFPAGLERAALLVEPRWPAARHLPVRHREKGRDPRHEQSRRRALANGDAGRPDVQCRSWRGAAALAVEPGRFRCRIRRDTCRAHPELRLGVASEDSPLGARRSKRGNACARGPRVGLIGGHGVECRSLAPPAAWHWSVDLRVPLTRREFADQGARCRDAEGRHLRADRRWRRRAGVDAQ